MFLIQIFLPLYRNDTSPLPKDYYETIHRELVSHFGGLTAYTRAPAKGLWQKNKEQAPIRDDLVIYEVITSALDKEWWNNYRCSLEKLFSQEKIMMYAQEITML